MSDLTHLSLFSGIGGLDLAAERAGFRTVGQCEWADYPRSVLEKHWPGLPRWRDIRTLTGDDFYEKTGLRTVTVLSGGFPCQPFSVAGKRGGKDDDRYLWPEMLRVIQEIRPAWVVGENVAGIVSLALDTVLSDLESIGYACQALVIPACAVDAPHRRDRVAILGYANDPGSGASEHGDYRHRTEKGRQIVAQCGTGGSGQDVADTSGTGFQRCKQRGSPDQSWEAKPYRSACKCGSDVSDSECVRRWQDCYQSDSHVERDDQAQKQDGGAELRPSGSGGSYVSYTDRQMRKSGIQFGDPAWECGFANDGWWPAEPDVGRVAHGVPARVDRLKCLGNAVVPQQFYPIFREIADLEVSQWENTQSAGCGL